MKRIFYASGSMVTSDRTAAAVLAYAQALAAREGSATVDVPALGEDGSEARAQLVIGPASQLMVVTEASDHDEFDDEATLRELAKRTEGLLRPHGIPVDVDDLNSRSTDDSEVVGAESSLRETPSGN